MNTGKKTPSVQQETQTNEVKPESRQSGTKREDQPNSRTTGDRISRSEENPARQPKTSQTMTKTISNVIGEIVWLMARSVNHRYLFISDLEWMIMQPVALAQYRMFYGENHPVGAAFWASVDKRVEKRLQQGLTRMSPQDWKSGDRIWLIDLIAPFGNVAKMLEDLKNNVFHESAFRYIQRNEKGQLVTRFSKEDTRSPQVDGSTDSSLQKEND